MSYAKSICEKCGHQLSLCGNEMGLLLPFYDQTDTLRWGVFCATERCSKLPHDTLISVLQNNHFNYRIHYKEKGHHIDNFRKREL